MRSFYASGVFSVVAVISSWADEHKGESAKKKLDEMMRLDTQKSVVEKLESYRGTLVELGLSGVIATLDKIARVFEDRDSTWGKFCELCDELKGRMIDETKDKTFFHLSLRESHIYNNPKEGWEPAIERFPTIADDVEEAQKCFAMSRYAAAIFHSLQVVEAGLIGLGKFLKVTDPQSGWTAVSQALKNVIDKKHPNRPKFEKKNFKFLEQMQGTVEGLKNAWRNKISHVQGRLVLISTEFSSEIAEEILLATRAFMRRLAEDLPVSKQKNATS